MSIWTAKGYRDISVSSRPSGLSAKSQRIPDAAHSSQELNMITAHTASRSRDLPVVPSPSIAPALPQGNTWIQTLSSGWLDLANPDPAHINFRHIAIVLARTPRFAGHTERGVYSVAQHCVEGAKAILRDGHGRDAAAAFLLHDAHEAYIGDMATPVVAALAALAKEDSNESWLIRHAVEKMKRGLDVAIYLAAGLDIPMRHDTIPLLVKSYDLRMLRTERDARLAKPPAPWAAQIEAAEPVEGCDLHFWGEDVARSAYLEMLRDFGICC